MQQQQLIVDCTTGDAVLVDVPAAEQLLAAASAREALHLEQTQQQAADAAAQARADAVQTILSAPEIAAHPALQAALAHILGGDASARGPAWRLAPRA